LPDTSQYNAKFKTEKENIRDDELEVILFKNEYKQVLLNLLTNAKDVLLEREISSPKIIIEINAKTVRDSDNGGGINVENIEKTFEPYFTRKQKGMDIGL